MADSKQKPQGTTTSRAETPEFEGISREDATGKSEARDFSSRKYSQADLLAGAGRFGTTRLLMAAALADAKPNQSFTADQIKRRVTEVSDREVQT